MPYIDGFVAVVPTANKENYRALKLVECWGKEVPDGELE